MKRSHYFIYSFFLSLPFWWGINVFGMGAQSYFFDKEIVKNPSILKAQMLSSISLPKAPEKLLLDAKSAISVLVKPDGKAEVIFEKNANEKLPIASLTKLMSSYVILNNLDLSGEIVAFDDKSFKAKDLLYASMTESSNEGITALTQPFGFDAFVNLMNMEVKYLGMNNTEFFNPTGLDPDTESEKANYSTAADLALLAQKLFSNPLALEMLSFKEFDLYDASGNLSHKSATTNSLLFYPEALDHLTILGGKTGETPSAGGCLMLAVKNARNEVIISVVLGSESRFSEMARLSNWSGKILNYKRILSALY